MKTDAETDAETVSTRSEELWSHLLAHHADPAAASVALWRAAESGERSWPDLEAAIAAFDSALKPVDEDVEAAVHQIRDALTTMSTAGDELALPPLSVVIPVASIGETGRALRRDEAGSATDGEVVGLVAAAAIAESFVETLAAGTTALNKLDIDEATRAGRRAASQVLAAARWSQIVGDRLDTTQVAQLLGVSRQALAKRQNSGSILGLPGDGTTWYPTWQFDTDASRIRPEVRDLIGAFRDRLDEVDPLLVAAWATTPQDEDLAGDTPAQWLRAGRDPHRLRRAAQRAAARLGR